jgi:hypothetical protein
MSPVIQVTKTTKGCCVYEHLVCNVYTVFAVRGSINRTKERSLSQIFKGAISLGKLDTIINELEEYILITSQASQIF